MRLIGFELRKLFLRLPILLALVLFTALDLGRIRDTLMSESWIHSDPLWNRVYWEQYDKYSGEIRPEKIEALLEVYRPLEITVNDLTATTRQDVEGTLTGNYYRDWNLLKDYYVTPMKRFYRYKSDAAEVAELARKNEALYSRLGNACEARKNAVIAELYQGRAVTEFYFTEGYRYYLHYDFSAVLIFLLLLYPLSQSFSRDRECRMTELMLTSPAGRIPSVLAKIAASSVYILAVSLWFSAADFAGFALFSNVTDAGNMPVYAVTGFREASVGLTLYGYSAVSALTRALGFWALGMIFLALGRMGRRALLPFAAGAGAFLVCTLAGVRWGYSSHTLVKALDPYSLLANRLLFGRTEFVNVFGHPVLTWQAGTVFAALQGTAAAALSLAPAGKKL